MSNKRELHHDSAYPQEMASLLRSPPFLSHSVKKRTYHFSSSQAPPPPPQPSKTPPELQSLKVVSPDLPLLSEKVETRGKRNRSVESTDWIASSLTRRFGLGAGLAWAGFLAFGVISEQIKTRLEVSQQQANTRDVEEQKEVVLPNGIRYYELRVGGGSSPRSGDLVVIGLKGKVEGTNQSFVDTFESKKKPLALVMGSRPYTKGMCEGIDYVVRSMKAGGKRRVIVPPNLGFGEKGSDFDSGVQIPPNATLEYIVEVDKVSIAPA
ncbi:peptidyl-prolyl cis-trans isomerase FKBP17-2, chloroplastic-like [Impatiens glandulifera]|uniref:peptidyl-prolyl cis-trans isomerase FKBP17-2, chloroplastic-like n=1 Tax=Impatiens glandulifera TaxID=253017 RepID=UPI001FB10BCF|nr:peptidyl-prolyl cis-trans isomerase FKBP17-2, chloroplastic-like [Impatiens glandulifera]